MQGSARSVSSLPTLLGMGAPGQEVWSRQKGDGGGVHAWEEKEKEEEEKEGLDHWSVSECGRQASHLPSPHPPSKTPQHVALVWWPD